MTSRQISGSNIRDIADRPRTYHRGGRNWVCRSCRSTGWSRAATSQEADAPRVEQLWDEIRRLKRDKRAFVPAHNYQVPEVQAIADTVGDSFELAVRARDIDANLVVFCGVRFMAEGCHTLAPDRPVYLPNLQALCSLAEVDADDVAERQEFLRAAGRRFATMTYVNTYADVKALSDTCCTSSNAARIAAKLGVPDLLFVPDQNLAYQVALNTKRMYLPPPEPHKFHPREYAEMVEPLIREGERQGLVGNVFAWEGACHVHHQMTVDDIARIRRDDPEATVIVHGEVRPELQRAADAVLSTSQMAKYVEAHPEQIALRDPDRVRPGRAAGAGAPGEAVLQAVPPLPVHEGDRPRERLPHAARRAAPSSASPSPTTSARAPRARCCG